MRGRGRLLGGGAGGAGGVGGVYPFSEADQII